MRRREALGLLFVALGLIGAGALLAFGPWGLVVVGSAAALMALLAPEIPEDARSAESSATISPARHRR